MHGEASVAAYVIEDTLGALGRERIGIVH